MNRLDEASMYRAMGFPAPPNNALKRIPRPKYVKLAPGDRGEHLPDFVFEGELGERREYHCIFILVGLDPRDFHPEPGPLGEIHAWGLYPVRPSKFPSNQCKYSSWSSVH